MFFRGEENMQKITLFIKLMRPIHYLKNGLVLVPLFFDGNIFEWIPCLKTMLGFVAFSLMSSVVYIINDINDIEADRKNAIKKHRPLAAGTIKIYEAFILAAILFCMAVLLTYRLDKTVAVAWLLIYLILNLAYSIKLKHVPIADVTVLASGYFIRLIYGAAITDIELSFWICMTAITFSLYMGLGKRRNELTQLGEAAHSVRGVLKNYNIDFLDKNMYVCLELAITFYALWTGDDTTIEKLGTSLQIWTVPIVIILAMKYSLDIENGDSGDPMEVILADKWLILIGIIYVSTLFIILYN